MGRGRVVLDAGAFVALILSSIETYRSECYGLLLGRRQNGTIHVQGALPYQTARRHARGVHFPERRRNAIQRVLDEMAQPEFLGEFHSHVDVGGGAVCEALSRNDMRGVQAREIQVLIAVRRARTAVAWRHNRDGSLSGAMGPYFVKLRAFHTVTTPRGGTAPRVAILRCRYALAAARRPPLSGMLRLTP